MPNRLFLLSIALVAGSCGGAAMPEPPGGPVPAASSTGGSSGSGGRAGGNATGGAPGVDGAGAGAPRSDGGGAADQAITPPSAPPPPAPPPPPGQIALIALAANGTVGLDWTRDSSATAYRIYWSNSPGVTPATGQRLESTEPSFVHRGVTNGMTYHYVVAVVTDAGEGKLSNPASATPGGEWALEELGAGDFNDVVTGGRIARLPIDRRIHILLLPEGYLETDLPVFHDHANHSATRPTNDVDRWVTEVFALDPYSKFREGFVIWYLPRSSAARIGGGATAFGQDASGAAAPLWGALDNQGNDAFPYPPSAASRNHVAAFLLFDPARGRAGVSGHASSCRHPTDRSLTIRCNFGVGHAHEFTHSFSDVRDEYLEDNNTRTGVADPWSNVTGTDRCGELPWAHLLFGRGINDKTDQLIGAFGRPQRGYHSEFKCQMNGTHENGNYWCAPTTSLTLRPARFCNWCRELTAFRLFFRTGVIPGSVQQAFSTWASMYRRPFFARHPIIVPTPVPQTVACSGQAERPVYEACVP